MQEQKWGRVINIGSAGGWLRSGELPAWQIGASDWNREPGARHV